MNGQTYRSGFVIMAGLPGMGKKALAEALSKRLGGIVLSKDTVRAALFPPGAITYSSGQNDFCMSELLMAAQRIVADQAVPFIFIDGRTFCRTLHVKQVIEAAAIGGAGYSILHRIARKDSHANESSRIRQSISPRIAIPCCTFW